MTALAHASVDLMPLGIVREELQAQLETGTTCPCCGQNAKVYRRKIHSGMARGLMMLYRAGAEHKYVHAPTVTRSGDSLEISKTRYWDLLVEEKDRRLDGGRSGWWKLTPLGVDFVRRDVLVPKYASVYNGRCYGLAGEGVSIMDALGSKFSYDELMNGQ